MKLLLISALVSAALLPGCAGTIPTMGSERGNTVATGSAGGSEAQNANAALERCDRPVGTAALFEETDSEWYRAFTQTYKLGSTLPALRLMIQQSNCFVIVERGKAFQGLERERALQQSGELKGGSNVGKGQLVSADYTISPEVLISARGTSGGSGNALSSLGNVGRLAGALAGGFRTNEASTMLMLIDNRSGVQVAAAQGAATNTDFNIAGALAGASGRGNAGGYTDTPQGKIVIAAFADSYNGIVRAVRSYKSQTVQGQRLGTGGKLSIDAEPAAPTSNAKAKK